MSRLTIPFEEIDDIDFFRDTLIKALTLLDEADMLTQKGAMPIDIVAALNKRWAFGYTTNGQQYLKWNGELISDKYIFHE